MEYSQHRPTMKQTQSALSVLRADLDRWLADENTDPRQGYCLDVFDRIGGILVRHLDAVLEDDAVLAAGQKAAEKAYRGIGPCTHARIMRYVTNNYVRIMTIDSEPARAVIAAYGHQRVGTVLRRLRNEGPGAGSTRKAVLDAVMMTLTDGEILQVGLNRETSLAEAVNATVAPYSTQGETSQITAARSEDLLGEVLDERESRLRQLSGWDNIRKRKLGAHWSRHGVGTADVERSLYKLLVPFFPARGNEMIYKEDRPAAKFPTVLAQFIALAVSARWPDRHPRRSASSVMSSIDKLLEVAC